MQADNLFHFLWLREFITRNWSILRCFYSNLKWFYFIIIISQVICIFLIACVFGVQCGAIIAAPAAYISANNELAEDAEVDPQSSHAAYHFEYAVNDATTGDHKSQSETRNGDVVSGQVSFLLFLWYVQCMQGRNFFKNVIYCYSKKILFTFMSLPWHENCMCEEITNFQIKVWTWRFFWIF